MAYLELTKHSSVSLFNKQVLKIDSEDRAEFVPIKLIKQITMPSKVTITTDVVQALSKAQVEVHILGSKTEKSISLSSLHTPSSALCLKQYAFVTNKKLSLKWYKALLKEKYRRQSTILARLGLAHCIGMDWSHSEIARLMLEEAKMAKFYWGQFAKQKATHSFFGRQRRPPTDPFNVLLSLASVMEAGLYKNAIVSHGLDPKLSFIHAVGYCRQSLIYDLKELTQPSIDWFCFQLLSSAEMTEFHFDEHSEAGLRLNQEGQKLFYRRWFQFAKDHQKEVSKTVKLARRIVNMEVANVG